MSIPTAGRRGLAAAGIITALLYASACGTQTAVDQVAPGVAPSANIQEQGQSEKALDADARRAAQGQLPSPESAPAGKRVPDTRP